MLDDGLDESTHAVINLHRSVGDDEETRQEMVAASTALDRIHETKRRKYVKQRHAELEALQKNVKAAMDHTAQLIEREKQATAAANKVCLLLLGICRYMFVNSVPPLMQNKTTPRKTRKLSPMSCSACFTSLTRSEGDI